MIGESYIGVRAVTLVVDRFGLPQSSNTAEDSPIHVENEHVLVPAGDSAGECYFC